ncbi:MAG: hypothetical protein EZS28_034174 [Streblomastix strix]|uniref:Protein kinase domain-containing protein n=1 Tax=Streblomastix strix TaxID=222440 RepID=A0A5J4UI93_9EUKA|nr:MAG: hypothetical protein EZS28_034174 [Streblomastix strix]
METKEIIRPSIVQDDQLWDLILNLLAFNPKERVSASDALRHVFFTGEKASNEITEEAKHITENARIALQNGDQYITKYDIQINYTLPLSEIKEAIVQNDIWIEIVLQFDRIESEIFEAFGLQWNVILLHRINQNNQKPQYGICIRLKSIDELDEEINQTFHQCITIHSDKQQNLESTCIHNFNAQQPQCIFWDLLKYQHLLKSSGFNESKQKYIFKIFTDSGLAFRHNIALLAAMKALDKSKREGTTLTYNEINQIAAQAIFEFEK